MVERCAENAGVGSPILPLGTIFLFGKQTESKKALKRKEWIYFLIFSLSTNPIFLFKNVHFGCKIFTYQSI